MESTIVICSNYNKEYILKKLSKENKLYNLKFYTFNDLKKKLFFDYDNRAVEYIMLNYQVNLNIAKIYLNNLYYLQNIDNKNIIFLNNLKKELDNAKLLIYDNHFREYISNKKIILYHNELKTKEEELILKELKYEEITEEKHEFKPKVYMLDDVSEEVLYVINNISKLYLDGIPLNNIKIIAPKEYTNYLKYYFSIFNIPINIKSTSSYYSTNIAHDFLKNYHNLSINEILEKLQESYDDLNDLITIINKSVLVKDEHLRLDFIIDDLKHHKIKNNTYKEAVNITNIKDVFLDDDFVFILGFNLGNYPKIYKDESYLNDECLKKLGLDTSIDKNIYHKNSLKLQLQNIKNLTITCLKSDDKTIFPSLLIDEMKLEVMEARNNPLISYSPLNTRLKYAECLDKLAKFNIISDDLKIYQSNIKLDYLSYSNVFKGINPNKLKDALNNELTLSYTNMEMYNECAFKYYLSKILKVDIFDSNFKAVMGSITHHILEIGINKDINIAEEMVAFLHNLEYKPSAKEYFYLEKLSEELDFILKVLKRHQQNSKLTNYLTETELYVYYDEYDIKVSFKGLIDKVMYFNNDEKEIIAVVDYKTGNTNITLDNLDFGLNIQLPIYLYLLKKSDRFKDAIPAGFYIEKVINKVPNAKNGKTLAEIKEEELMLQGFSNSSPTIISLLDKDFKNSKMIKDLKFKKDGNLSAKAKVLSNEEMDELTIKTEELINDVITNILSGKFPINPKVIKKNNIACEYCKFKDICFTTKSDEVILVGGEEDEDDTEAN